MFRQGDPDTVFKSLAWRHRMVGPDHMAHQLPNLIPAMPPYSVPRSLRNVIGGLAEIVPPRVVPGKKAAEGAAPLAYAINNVSVEYVHDDPGISLGFWRSVAFPQNVFCVECFMDEMPAGELYIVPGSHPPTGIG